jgi:hypothetical protein
MKLHKTVTTAKIEANRRNSKRSTGPRTQRGKRTAKYNAVTLGLFAKHVVIPICDGYKAEKDFTSLLDGLNQDFQPIGFYEEWLVVKIAECMWRLRRATRCESGSVRESAAPWEKLRPWEDREENLRLLDLQMNVWALTDAENQLRDCGTLSQETFDRVAPLVREEQRKTMQSDKSVKPDNPQEFLAHLTNLKGSLELTHRAQSRVQDQRSDIRFDYEALLPEVDMDRIFRYEERMHRHLDWAVERLLESQERRKTLETSAGPVLLPASKSVERSQ